MATQTAIQVDGLRELKSALRKAPKEARDALKGTGREVAERVATGARGFAASRGSTAAKSAGSIRATGAARNALGAGVIIGGAAYPFALGAEFGGGRRPTTRQFLDWRGSGSSAGYFLYPTIRANAEQIFQEYGDAIMDALDSAGLT